MAVRHLLSARHRMLVFIDVSITYSKTGKECVDTTSAEDRGKKSRAVSGASSTQRSAGVHFIHSKGKVCVKIGF